MPSEKKGQRNRIRFLLIAGLAAVFVGLILVSALRIRYPVDRTRMSEFTITELSLTDSIKRGRQGKLATAGDAGGQTSGKKRGSKACPT